ncbi:PQQ-binding-like beta-propeller repeat protein [Candidatus Oscillochloris fontis]|uniref:WD40 domain-containing protein n=1 Tax=Candidatus Oscillochloris fontis TaxID=2496868 RepID=UPI00101D036D|nr:PQQ-binding-like beta-propeller repeat protein [Candidatus Oscillochloris fontis]
MSHTPITPPFRGPRPFQVGERLYGRDYEARTLLSMLVAERAVLLHSPSGAGKTSLIQAALLPLLAERDFVVLPTVRVGEEAPPGWVGNRYVRAMLLALEEGQADDDQISTTEISATSLKQYLTQRIPKDQDTVLIIDQFEEVLTRDPTDQDAKAVFFRELGAALQQPRLWVLCVVREEYVAALEPFMRLLPNRLAAHFRLDLLGVEGALEALCEPLRSAGVDIPTTQANRLIDDLRRVNVQQADGSIRSELGPSVEPVQLQVVGLRLWERLPPGTTSISAQQIDALGDVGTALGDYYAERAASVAQASGVAERTLRNWFEHELITPQGVRGQVLQGAGSSAGLENSAITLLIDAYLVRAEPRRGATWYELAHDRLIAPIQANNAFWFESNLSTLQRQAQLWEQQGRPEGLLLRGASLLETEAWATQHSKSLTSSERDFLDLCRRARQRAALLRNLSIAVAVVAVIALILALIANAFRIQAEQNARQARSRELAAAAVSNLQVDPQRSLILAHAAYATSAAAGDPAPPETLEALHQALAASRVRQIIRVSERGLQDLALSPDGRMIATNASDGQIHLIDRAQGQEIQHITANDAGLPTFGLAFSPDGTYLAAGSSDQIMIWAITNGQVAYQFDAHPESGAEVMNNDILAVAFSPDGSVIASGSADGTARLWDRNQDQPIYTLEVGSEVWAIAYSPDGRYLATGDFAGQIMFWDVLTGDLIWSLPAHQDLITGMAISPDGSVIASSSADLSVRLWASSDGSALDILRGHVTTVETVAFSRTGDRLATASADGSAKVWAMNNSRMILSLMGHENGLSGAIFSPDGAQLITSSLDGTLRTWDLSLAPADGAYGAIFSPAGDTLATYGATQVQIWNQSDETMLYSIEIPILIATIAYHPQGTEIAVGSIDGTILLITPQSGTINQRLEGHSDQVNRIAYSPDGQRLVSASRDGSLSIWDCTDGSEIINLPTTNSDEVTVVAFSPAGSMIASVANGEISLWDAAGQSLGKTWTLRSNEIVQGLTFSHDGRWLAAGNDSGDLAIWEVSTSREVARITTQSAFTDLAFSPDGTHIASAERTRQVRIWDAATLQQIQVLPHPSEVYTVNYHPQGSSIVSASADGIARIMPVSTADLLRLVTQTTLRPASRSECTTYGQFDGC